MTSMAYIINVLEEAKERNQKLHRVVLTGMKNKYLLNKKYTSFNKSVKQVKCEEKKSLSHIDYFLYLDMMDFYKCYILLFMKV